LRRGGCAIKKKREASVFRAGGVVLIKLLILMVIDQHHPGRS
jgi:hypothetical protein